MRRGSIIIIPIIFLILSAGAIYYVDKYSPRSGPSQTQIPVIAPSSTPIPTPTYIPTPAPTHTPTSKPTTIPLSGLSGSGYSVVTISTPKGNFSAQVLSLDMASTRIITDTADDSDCPTNCQTKSLSDFVTKNGGFAGVNGTYFCPTTYPECAAKTNSFDFSVYNSRLNKWINQRNLFWGGRAMVYFDGSGAHYKQNASDFSGGLTAGIVNYPGLVNDGNVQIDDNQSGLSDKQKVKNTKIGLGIRNQNTVLVVVAGNVTMQEFAYVFKSLGASGALNLDTGGSAALYYSGRYLIGPGRALPNAVIFARK